MNAEIITIGDEILIGQIVDTNSTYISKELNKIGIDVRQITSVQDEKSQILSTLKSASEKASLVIITGGLGPTRDDITKQCLCEYFEDELIPREDVLEHIKKIYISFKGKELPEMDRQQAWLPSKAEVLTNNHGSASGMWFEKDETVYISLPGVPLEMKALMEKDVLPRLQKRFKTPFIVHKTAVVYGLGESTLAEKIVDWEEALPGFLKLAYLPGKGFVRLRLSARGLDEQALKTEIDERFSKLHELVGDRIKSYDDGDPIQAKIAAKLVAMKKTLATAESCTGGRIAALFTESPGASKFFKGSIVSYATAIKHDVLGIPEETIAKFSVVSEEVAIAMAESAKKILKTDYALSTTGNLGPEKGDSDAEIGTVFIGLATPGETKVFGFNFGNHREKTLGKTVNKAFEVLWDEVFGKA
jgi:nicotinamide-nucleotide amidase